MHGGAWQTHGRLCAHAVLSAPSLWVDPFAWHGRGCRHAGARHVGSGHGIRCCVRPPYGFVQANAACMLTSRGLEARGYSTRYVDATGRGDQTQIREDKTFSLAISHFETLSLPLSLSLLITTNGRSIVVGCRSRGGEVWARWTARVDYRRDEGDRRGGGGGDGCAGCAGNRFDAFNRTQTRSAAWDLHETTDACMLATHTRVAHSPVCPVLP
jgi:hypothetical protein